MKAPKCSLGLIWALCLCLILPFGFMMGISVLHAHRQTLVSLPLTVMHYQALFDPLYLRIFLKSFYIAFATTLICLVLGYPFAYCIAQASQKIKPVLMMLLIIPFWTSSLIRTYAMMAFLKAHGLLNSALLALGVIAHPLPLLYTNLAVFIGLVYNLLPFMVMPLIVTLERLDVRLIEAARDLGATSWQTFTKVVLPATLPGILGGSLLVFLPAMTLFYIPDLLGGAKSMLLGNLIQHEFLFARNWPMGAAISVLLTGVMLCLFLLYWRNTTQTTRGVML